MPSQRVPTLFAAVLFGWGSIACAHHSFGEYDQSTLVEIEGTIARVQWKNPHVRIYIEVPGNGLWDLESAAANQLRRLGIDEVHFGVGCKVKVAGYPSSRRSEHLYTAHMLQDNGQELVLFRNLIPRWTNDAVGFSTASDPERAGTAANGTIFSVWGSQLSDPDANPGALARGSSDYPYTAAARSIREEWLQAQRPPLNGCTPKGMPLIMEQPFRSSSSTAARRSCCGLKSTIPSA